MLKNLSSLPFGVLARGNGEVNSSVSTNDLMTEVRFAVHVKNKLGPCKTDQLVLANVKKQN